MGSNKSGGAPPQPAPKKGVASAKLAGKPAAKKQVAKGDAPKGAGRKGAAPMASKPEPAPLVVEIDGGALQPGEAQEIWRAFSAHMDDHQGDLVGFAQLRGWKSVAPTYRRGSAVLVVTTR